MYELCALLSSNSPKAKKIRKPAAKAIKVGSSVTIQGRSATITGRDHKYANAWFASFDGIASPYSFSRDMIKVL